jgi:anti-sigma regulatory factor (Ser/Thr protein kinase)
VPLDQLEPEPQVRLKLSTCSRPDAVRRARRALATFQEVQADRQLAFDAELLVSELVGNAVTHGSHDTGETIELTAELDTRRLRVQVSDGGPGFILGADDPEPPALDQTSGRGLHLLRTLADRFGVDDRSSGGDVWFEIDLARHRPVDGD